MAEAIESSRLEFNTGRQYTEEGQVIVAMVERLSDWRADDDPEFAKDRDFDMAHFRVRFHDHSRGICYEFTCAAFRDGNWQNRIMKRYDDNNCYDSSMTEDLARVFPTTGATV